VQKVRIKIIEIEGECSKHKVGDQWIMENGTLYDPDNNGICIYALNAIRKGSLDFQIQGFFMS